MALIPGSDNTNAFRIAYLPQRYHQLPDAEAPDFILSGTTQHLSFWRPIVFIRLRK